MKTFRCQVCKHIAFDEAPVDCPVCGAAIENFEKDEASFNLPVDPSSLTESEKKHVPVIKLNKDCPGDYDNGCISVLVKVGDIEHIMAKEHLIEFVDFYINKKYLSRLAFTAKIIHPAALLYLTDSTGTLSVIAHCNVHGSWRTKIKLDEQ